jgi:4-amino-4-deoxy-L-arabinose transferase-like glycosyltransferase
MSRGDSRLIYGILAGIVALFVGLGALYAIYTPPWQTPDEPAHYNYVAQIVEGGCCPIITPEDWDAAYLEELKEEQFPEEADLSAIQYEDHQPPLYYLAASLVYRLSHGNLVALRMLSVVFGAGVVLAAYFAVARLCPNHKPLALAAAAFVAFIPQHVAMMAGVGNDSLAELVLGVITVVAITYLGNPLSKKHGEDVPLDVSSRPHAAALGGLTGIAFLTKLSIYLPAVLIVAAAILLRWRHEKRSLRWLAEQIGWSAGLALLIGGWWWVRNGILYGWPDLFAQRAHVAVVEGQLRTADHIAALGLASYLREFLTVTYHSFWGQFGWMGVPMPSRDYLLIGLFLIWNLAGLVIFLTTFRKHLALTYEQRAGIVMLGLVLLASMVGYIYYNLTFVQFQGRYLYPALIPLGGLVAVGIWGWALLAGRGLHSERRQSILDWMPLVALFWMPLLALWALFRYIVPNLG